MKNIDVDSFLDKMETSVSDYNVFDDIDTDLIDSKRNICHYEERKRSGFNRERCSKQRGTRSKTSGEGFQNEESKEKTLFEKESYINSE